MRKYELIREYYNLSQQELADAIGCTRQAISKFEIGKTKDSFIEEFYNHKFLLNLTEKLHGDFLPPFEYIQFVLESLSIYAKEDELKKLYGYGKEMEEVIL